MPEAAVQHRLNAPARQPGRIMAYAGWKENGACHDHPTISTADFYPSDDMPPNGEIRDAHDAMLRNLCLGNMLLEISPCPVLDQCRELAKLEEWGFLAGQTEEERRKSRARAKKQRYRDASGNHR